MGHIDILSLILSFLGIYGIVFSVRFLLPRHVVPLVKTSFEEAMSLVERTEAVNIPYVSEYRVSLAMYACLHPSAVSRANDSLAPNRTQSTQPILADAHRQPSLSWFFPATLLALSLWSDLETVHPQMASRCYQAKDRGGPPPSSYIIAHPKN